MITRPIRTRLFKEGEDLNAFIIRHIPKLKERSILVVTSKIVALAERRTATTTDIRTKDALIKRESEWAIPTKYVWLTVKDGMVMPSAGIDESNADGKLILLPKDSYRAAREVRQKLKKHYKLKELGVLITDSRTMPLRAGVTGVSLGYAGFKGIKDYVGKKDLFNRPFKFSRVDIPDSLAAAAVLTMGEGAERCPLAIIERAPVEFCERVKREELTISIHDDMYRPLFTNLPERVKPSRPAPSHHP